MHAELETALSELHLSTERWEAILAAAGRMTERENKYENIYFFESYAIFKLSFISICLCFPLLLPEWRP